LATVGGILVMLGVFLPFIAFNGSDHSLIGLSGLSAAQPLLGALAALAFAGTLIRGSARNRELMGGSLIGFGVYAGLGYVSYILLASLDFPALGLSEARPRVGGFVGTAGAVLVALAGWAILASRPAGARDPMGRSQRSSPNRLVLIGGAIVMALAILAFPVTANAGGGNAIKLGSVAWPLVRPVVGGALLVLRAVAASSLSPGRQLAAAAAITVVGVEAFIFFLDGVSSVVEGSRPASGAWLGMAATWVLIASGVIGCLSAMNASTDPSTSSAGP